MTKRARKACELNMGDIVVGSVVGRSIVVRSVVVGSVVVGSIVIGSGSISSGFLVREASLNGWIPMWIPLCRFFYAKEQYMR